MAETRTADLMTAINEAHPALTRLAAYLQEHNFQDLVVNVSGGCFIYYSTYKRPAAPMAPEPEPIVHVLYEGVSLCQANGTSTIGAVVPRDWPPGHAWVSMHDRAKATCEQCASAAERKERMRG